MNLSKKVNTGLVKCGGSSVILSVSVFRYVRVLGVREPLIGFPWNFILKFVVDFQVGYIPEDLRALGCLNDAHIAEYHSGREKFIVSYGCW